LFWIVSIVFLAGTASAWFVYLLSPISRARRDLSSRVRALKRELRVCSHTLQVTLDNLRSSARRFIEERRRAMRLSTPVEALKNVGADRVRWGALHSAGLRTLHDVSSYSQEALQQIPGIGEASAGKIVAAVRVMEQQIQQRPVPYPDRRLDDSSAVAVVAAFLHTVEAHELLVRPLSDARRVAAPMIESGSRHLKKLTLLAWLSRAVRNRSDSPLLELAAERADACEACLSEPAMQRLRKAHDEFGEGVGARAGSDDLGRRYREALVRHEDIIESIWPSGGPSIAVASDGPATPSSPPPAEREADADRLQAPQAVETRASRKEASAPPQEVRWIPPGERAEVCGYEIAGGMIYLGPGQAEDDWSEEIDPSLIDPSLPIDGEHPATDGEGMVYWPSYSLIPAPCRAAYLEWLADGRRAPGTNIGYVFLFYYGIERRLLLDSTTDVEAADESPLLLNEIERLSSIYGSNRSFQGYSQGLLDFVRVQKSRDRPLYREEPPVRTQYRLPIMVEVALGQAAADDVPLPVEWAWCWLLGDPMLSLRTPAMRCPEEFEQIFRLRYGERFGDGIRLHQGTGDLVATYQPANVSFGQEFRVRLPVKEVQGSDEALRRLRELAESCTDELDAYSRFLGRNSGSGVTLTARALLPAEVLLSTEQPELEALRHWLRERLSDGATGVVPTKELVEHCYPEGVPDRAGKAESISVALLLQQVGVGMEPDPRFGGPPLSRTQVSSLFRTDAESPTAPSTTFSAAQLVLRLSSSVATADGDVSEEERSQLLEQIEERDHLSSSEKLRLRAHMEWLLADPPGLGGLKKRLAGLDGQVRDHIGLLLVGVAGADGQIDPTEIDTLTNLYGMLGLDPDSVYGHVHALSGDGDSSEQPDEPVVVQTATPRVGEHSIPSPPAAELPVQGIGLNMNLVRAKMQETAAISSILQSIFVDEEEQERQPAPPPPEAVVYEGLDEVHSGLLQLLIEKDTWIRAEFEVLCADHQVLPDVAL